MECCSLNLYTIINLEKITPDALSPLQGPSKQLDNLINAGERILKSKYLKQI